MTESNLTTARLREITNGRIPDDDGDCYTAATRLERDLAHTLLAKSETCKALEARIAELEARLGAVTVVTDERVEAAAKAVIPSLGCGVVTHGSYELCQNIEMCVCRKEARDALAAALAVSAERVRHKKRGSTYRVLSRQGTMQTETPVSDMQDGLVVYQCEEDGKVWVRPSSEFDDGRFETL